MIQQTPSGNKLTGFYLGKVLKHLSHGCIKAFIPSVYPESLSASPDSLPVCMQVVPQFVGNNAGNGVFSYPNIGSTVVCFFANGDQNLPMTIGSVQGGNDAVHQYNIINQINDSKVIKDKLNADGYVHDDSYDEVYDINTVSKLHRMTAGKISLTFFEHDDLEHGGIISACITDPIQTHVNALANIDTKQELVMHGTDAYTFGTISASATDYYGKAQSQVLMNEDAQISSSTSKYDDSKMTSTKHVTQSQDKLASVYFDEVNAKDQISSMISQDTSAKTQMKNDDVKSKRSSSFLQDTTSHTSIISQDDDSQVTCFFDMKTTGAGDIEIHSKSSGGHSFITLTKDGVMTIDTTDSLNVSTTSKVSIATADVTIDGSSSISLKAPTITIDGSTKVSMTGSEVDIAGDSGDCKIDNTSLNQHTHPFDYNAGPSPAKGTTNAPVP